MRCFPNLNKCPVLLFFILGFVTQGISGQSYTTTLGLRLGDGIGISARQRLLKRVTAEGIFYQHHKSDQTVAGIMLTQHMPVITKRLNLYAGGGAGRVFNQDVDALSREYNAVFVNAGLEFTISRLNMSWDFIPIIPVSKEEGLTTMTAFSLRYVIIKKSKKGIFRNDKKENQRHKNHKRPQKRKNRRR